VALESEPQPSWPTFPPVLPMVAERRRRADVDKIAALNPPVMRP
jgi:hypothetical protein